VLVGRGATQAGNIMYAIKSGTKFVKARFYLDPNEVFDFSISDEPKTYKTRAEAERVMKLVLDKIARSIRFYTEQIDSDSLKARKSQLKIYQLTEKLEELYTQPFKEVEQKVARVRKQISDAEWYTNNNSIRSWSRDLARVTRIGDTGLTVVKIQQVVEMA
jgi:hypothetical protein